MDSIEFESKIRKYVNGGYITDEHRWELYQDAKKLEIEKGELDIVIDGYVYLDKQGKLGDFASYEFDYSKWLEEIEQTSENSIVYPTESGFSWKKFFLLLLHNKWARLLAIAGLLIIFWPVIYFLLLCILCLLIPDGSEKQTSDKDSVKIEVVTPTKQQPRTKEILSEEQSNHENEQKLEIANDDKQENTEVEDVNVDNNSDVVNGDYPEGSLRLLTADDLMTKSKAELKIMRNEIFARHGYIFKTPAMIKHFANQSWYHGRYTDVSSMLSNIERKNVSLIKKYENR